ncbi:MAG: hypothetical protein GH151_09375 [Bacteroidetes bacterium]|nr:hypothetical protein [Bacteroidota bacterium]
MNKNSAPDDLLNISDQQKMKGKKEEYQKFLSQTDDKKYYAFVEYIFGNNEVGEPFEKCLSMKNQISPKIFTMLIKKYPWELIKNKLNAMENKQDLLKKYTSFFRTLNDWCSR